MSDLKVFTSKIDSELKKACQIYCIKEEIDFMQLLDKSLRSFIGYERLTVDEENKIFNKE